MVPAATKPLNIIEHGCPLPAFVSPSPESKQTRTGSRPLESGSSIGACLRLRADHGLTVKWVR